MGTTSGAGTAYRSGAPEFTPVFSGVRVTRYLILCEYFVNRCLSFCNFSFWPLSCLFSIDLRILIDLFGISKLVLEVIICHYAQSYSYKLHVNDVHMDCNAKF